MRMDRLLALALLAAGAGCASGPRTEPRFERPIRVEARAEGALLVEGKEATWESLGDALRDAIRASGLAGGAPPSAFVRVERACPEGTSARLLDALIGAGVKEILLGEPDG